MNFNLALPFYNMSLEHPDRLALFADGKKYSYAELAGYMQKIAGWLHDINKGTRPKRIGILGSRSVEACAAVLGISFAGGTYVPISPKLPAERLVNIISLSGLDALITDERGAKLLSEKVLAACPAHIAVPEKNELLKNHNNKDRKIYVMHDLPNTKTNPVQVAAKDIVYIIFTSGTTGIPKGVMVYAEAVNHIISYMLQRYKITPEDRISENTELGFDVSVYDMFMAWNSGASLHIIPDTQAMAPAKFICGNGLTLWSSVPSIIGIMKSINMLQANVFPTLRYSLFAGEPLSLAAAQAWQHAAPNSTVDNLYGPTEATIVCIGQRLTNPPVITPQREVVATGKAFPGMEAAIFDEQLNFLPAGEHGQLALSGIQLAAGYLNKPELTEAQFKTVNGKRWYLTGDLALQDSAGIFHHLGRIDNQVKVMGNRVELEEIETHLREVCASELVAAVAWPVIQGSASGIIAFVSGTKTSETAIRAALKEKLPAYMVPKQIHFIDSIPMSTNRKVDRKALIQLLDTNEIKHTDEK